MSARDVAQAALDQTVDGITTDASTATELFAVVDVLDGQPALRRSLTDPSATGEARARLAERLFGGKVSPATLEVVRAAVQAAWNSGTAMAAGLDRLGVRVALRAAHAAGELGQVTGELDALTSTVADAPELAEALRSRRYPLAGKRELLDKLIGGKVSPTTATLAARALSARRRTFALTLDSYLDMAAGLVGAKTAQVTVARPLDDARIQRLRSALEAHTGGPVSLRFRIDPSALGGMSVQIDDDVFESTVAARLDDARRQLINM